MKNFLLVFVLSFISQISSSQCTTPANNFGNNIAISSYNVTGDVAVTLNNDDTITLDLGSNFQTASGPDIRAYLVNSNGASAATLRSSEIANLDHIEFGLVGCTGCVPAIPSNGAKSLTVSIPNGKNIEDFDTVFFYCLQFDQFWDFGSYTSFTASNCSVLSVEENIQSIAFKVYPNPTNDYLEITNEKQLPVAISVFNVLGHEVFKKEESTISKIKLNLSALKSGVYLLRTTHNNAYSTNRFIKR